MCLRRVIDYADMCRHCRWLRGHVVGVIVDYINTRVVKWTKFWIWMNCKYCVDTVWKVTVCTEWPLVTMVWFGNTCGWWENGPLFGSAWGWGSYLGLCIRVDPWVYCSSMHCTPNPAVSWSQYLFSPSKICFIWKILFFTNLCLVQYMTSALQRVFFGDPQLGM